MAKLLLVCELNRLSPTTRRVYDRISASWTPYHLIQVLDVSPRSMSARVRKLVNAGLVEERWAAGIGHRSWRELRRVLT